MDNQERGSSQSGFAVFMVGNNGRQEGKGFGRNWYVMCHFRRLEEVQLHRQTILGVLGPVLLLIPVPIQAKSLRLSSEQGVVGTLYLTHNDH